MTLPQRARICLLIPHLGGGGAEHVIETLARHLNPEKYEIHLVLTASLGSGVDLFHSNVRVHQLRAPRVRHSALQLVSLIWRVRPHLILSGIAYLNLLVLSLRPVLPPHIRFLVRHNGALAATFASHSYPLLARRAYCYTYRRADSVICQSDSMSQEIAQELRVEHRKLLVLPNPTDVQRLRKSAAPSPAQLDADTFLFLAVGRLVPEKGFDILIDAFSHLSISPQSAELVIAGRGPQRSALVQQAKALGVSDRVHFPGYLPDPFQCFSQASVFVQPSRTEGLPNALLEAAAAGMPIVATPACRGVVDLLRNQDGAWLTHDASPDALRKALETAFHATKYRNRFRHAWIDQYDLSRAIPAYEAVIDRLIARQEL
jgi:glycosyltransferase involved in cell wall biosynthesis